MPMPASTWITSSAVRRPITGEPRPRTTRASATPNDRAAPSGQPSTSLSRHDRRFPFRVSTCSLLAVAALSVLATGCGRQQTGAIAAEGETAAVIVGSLTVVEESITRFIRVSGTLVAQEKAEVSAEINGRVVATPIERGSRVGANDELIRISGAEVAAQADEAQANVAQIEARLGIAGGEAFDVERVPEVASAKASHQLAVSELDRARQLSEQRLLSPPSSISGGAGRGRGTAVRHRQERRPAAVPVAGGRAGPRQPGEEGGRRCHRAGAFFRGGRRAARVGR